MSECPLYLEIRIYGMFVRQQNCGGLWQAPDDSGDNCTSSLLAVSKPKFKCLKCSANSSLFPLCLEVWDLVLLNSQKYRVIHQDDLSICFSCELPLKIIGGSAWGKLGLVGCQSQVV